MTKFRTHPADKLQPVELEERSITWPREMVVEITQRFEKVSTLTTLPKSRMTRGHAFVGATEAQTG
jgi:hypothetical protein